MYPLTIGLAISNPEIWQQVQVELQSLPVRIVLEQAGLVEDPISFVEKVDRFRPDVLLFEPAASRVDLNELIPSLKATAAQPFIVVVRHSPSAEDILRAIRAGANEYIYPPLQDTLREVLQRISQVRANKETEIGASVLGKAIGFLSVKGGCGATTLACHGAVDLARLSAKSVLLADFDLSAGAIRVLMKVKSRYSILDAFKNTQRLDESYWSALVSNGYQGVEVIAGSSAEVLTQYPGPHDVRQVLRFARRQYNHVVLDLGAGIDPNALSALEELDELILVATPDVPALQMAKLSVLHLTKSGFRRDRVRLVLNRMSRRVDLSPEEIENAIGISIYATIPNDYAALDRAYSAGELLPENNHVRDGIRRLVRRLGNLEEENPRRRFTLFGML